MRELVWIAIAGALRACTRYLVGLGLPRVPNGFPWATLLVNLCGCFLLGLLLSLPADLLASSLKRAIAIGYLGSLTTFSTFASDSLDLAAERGSAAAANIACNVLLGLLLAWGGRSFALYWFKG